MQVIAEENGVEGDFFILCIEETACIGRAEADNVFGGIGLKIREFEEREYAIECLIGVEAHRRVGRVGQIMNASPAGAGFDGFCFEDDFLFGEFLGETIFLELGEFVYILRCFCPDIFHVVKNLRTQGSYRQIVPRKQNT